MQKYKVTVSNETAKFDKEQPVYYVALHIHFVTVLPNTADFLLTFSKINSSSNIYFNRSEVH